ncbi:MarR family transcriptional regulator [Mycobacteroides abscessus subsp. massiliense]|nr:MarR family transcriptional regulator [Mycobacteroides abscessus subsp. massiliense]
MYLSEVEGHRGRMSGLATASDLSLSGMTRVISRLESQGLVNRERDDCDGWGQHAVLTSCGQQRLEQTWPTHLASVRRHIFDRVECSRLDALVAPQHRGFPVTVIGATMTRWRPS